MHRFFGPASSIRGNQVVLSEAQSHQIAIGEDISRMEPLAGEFPEVLGAA